MLNRILLQDVGFSVNARQHKVGGRTSCCIGHSISQMRQNLLKREGPDGSVLVRTYPVTFPTGYRSKAHSHDWDQLTYAAHGVMTVHTEKGIWVVPPHRAVWVPAGLEHIEEMSGPVAARSRFFVPGLSRSLPRDCSTVNVHAVAPRSSSCKPTRLGVLTASFQCKPADRRDSDQLRSIANQSAAVAKPERTAALKNRCVAA